MATIRFCLVAALLLCSAGAQGAEFAFDEPPPEWATALAAPGRQLVGDEPSISFDIASDVFVINPDAFGIATILFANEVVASLPASANVVVVQDAQANAGAAANAIAGEVTVSTPGFFVYFNTNLNLPRLVYSADLSDDTADLLVLARLTNLTGQLAALPTFTAANFSLNAADLSITKTAAASSLAPGAIFDYIITVANAGPVSATDVVVQDALPGSLQLVGATPSQGSCNAVSPVVCNLGTIAPGASATITLSVRVVATTGTITNTATVDAPEGDAASVTSVGIAISPAIPTLSEWALLVLAALLGIGAVLKLRTA